MAVSSAMRDERNPTEVVKEPFLYVEDENAETKYGRYNKIECGKWMMFFSKSDLDDKWKEARRLFYDGQLIGVHSMKVSTSFYNSRANDKNSGVIIFYCGPCTDESKMKEYGLNLLAVFPYTDRSGYMYYKSDMQTMAGTRATGQKVNSLYKLPLINKVLNSK